MRRSKYGNVRVERDGNTFDSKAEARYYAGLELELYAGLITDLVFHPRFELQPAFVDPHTGKRVQAIVYEGDAGFKRDGVEYVADVKGVRTRDFSIKEKLFRFKYRDIVLLVIPSREV